MRALQYDFSARRWLLARLAGGRLPAVALACSGVRLRDLPEPRAPAPDWVPLTVALAGICGTDVSMLRGRTGPQLSPFASFPAVPGHEVLAVPESGALAGRRVVLDPFLGCAARGLPPCTACAEGHTALCHRFAQGSVAPGMLLGVCRDLPGGWGERMVAPPGALHAVPDELQDAEAVLAEPLAVAMHAVLGAPVAPGDRILVLGTGTVGLCVLAALRLLDCRAQVVAVARHRQQRQWAQRLGAATVTDLAAVEDLAGARGYGTAARGLLGTRGWTGGFDRAFDTVGSAASLSTALRLVRAAGRVDLLGCTGQICGLDLTWAWAHEVQLHGFCGYGAEPSMGGEHTMALALRLLAAHRDLGLQGLVTHRFGLADHRQALAAAFFHGRSGSIKVVFDPRAG